MVSIDGGNENICLIPVTLGILEMISVGHKVTRIRGLWGSMARMGPSNCLKAFDLQLLFEYKSNQFYYMKKMYCIILLSALCFFKKKMEKISISVAREQSFYVVESPSASQNPSSQKSEQQSVFRVH